jgi:hypothetical protein
VILSLQTAGFDGIIEEANFVADCAGLEYFISSLQQCNSTFYNNLYKALTGASIVFNTLNEEKNCQSLIDALEQLLSPYVRLAHIRGCDLANLDEMSVTHMLDVFILLLGPKSSARGMNCW